MINILATGSAVIGTALMVILFAAAIIRYFVIPFRPECYAAVLLSQPEAVVTDGAKWKNAFFHVLIWFTVSRVVIFLATVIYTRFTGQTDAYLSYFFTSWWNKWDAPHYVGLVENWYVAEGDARFHIVFFPVYPLICKLFLPLTGQNALASCYIVSNLCAVAAGTYLYKLTALTYPKETAKRAARFFFFNPMSFFLSIPYTESLFILLVVSSVYYARKEQFIPALLIGMICSATRLMGLVVAIPIFYEMLLQDRRQSRLAPGRVCKQFLSCCMILAGFGAYLWLNYRVTGNPFQFWIYQKEHWSNTSGTLWNTFRYIIAYIPGYSADMALGTWIPTIIALYGAVILTLYCLRRTRSGDSAYAWAYMYMTIVPTWLISGPRYVSGLYTLYPMLADRIKNRVIDILVSILLLALCCCMSCLFLFTSSVY